MFMWYICLRGTGRNKKYLKICVKNIFHKFKDRVFILWWIFHWSIDFLRITLFFQSWFQKPNNFSASFLRSDKENFKSKWSRRRQSLKMKILFYLINVLTDFINDWLNDKMFSFLLHTLTSKSSPRRKSVGRTFRKKVTCAAGSFLCTLTVFRARFNHPFEVWVQGFVNLQCLNNKAFVGRYFRGNTRYIEFSRYSILFTRDHYIPAVHNIVDSPSSVYIKRVLVECRKHSRIALILLLLPLWLCSDIGFEKPRHLLNQSEVRRTLIRNRPYSNASNLSASDFSPRFSAELKRIYEAKYVAWM